MSRQAAKWAVSSSLYKGKSNLNLTPSNNTFVSCHDYRLLVILEVLKKNNIKGRCNKNEKFNS